MIKVNPLEFKQKWIEAARSGKYKKGMGRYHDPEMNCYCILGLGGEIYRQMINGKWDDEGHKIIAPDTIERQCPSAGYLRSVSDLELFINEDYSLMTLNDNRGYTFPQLADVIEKYCHPIE